MSVRERIQSLVRGKPSRHTPQPMEDPEFLRGVIRKSDLFSDLPSANIDAMVARMETVAVRKSEDVVREGDEGDYYYLLVAGTADVIRKSAPDGALKVVARLMEPLGFGEEALISNAKRNATIRMRTDGSVMRLSRRVFDTFVKEPLITWYSPREAQEQIAKGARWLDVRDPKEVNQKRLPGAQMIPLAHLRERIGELQKTTLHICYCATGRMSSVACFLLRQRGYNAGVLRGGVDALMEAGIG